MPRRRQDQAVAQRANEVLDEQAQRRREAARRGAQTRRRRREQREAEAQAERPTQGNVARNQPRGRLAGRRPRAHREMLTVAVRGPIAEKMRAMAERYGMSLAKLLADMVLVYEREVAGGYEAGTCLEGRAARPEQET